MAEHGIPRDILDDLGSRFIINVPEEERKDLIRICFQIELAHWFYLDFYCSEDNSNRKLKSCGMKEFTSHMFNHIPFLRQHLPKLDSVLEQWREYKHSVPTFGAIVLNDDLTKVLLVQNYWPKNTWGFPKGKVNEDEDPSHCAVREVLEETGFDISNLIDKNEYMESIINDRLVRLYIIAGVQMDTKFEPRTRKEIKTIEWFSIADLPNNTKDMTPKVKIGFGPHSFFMVVPFVRRMKRWVMERQQKEKQAAQAAAKRHRHKSVGDVETGQRNRRQGPQNGLSDMKNERQSNTSPNRHRRAIADKNNGKNSEKLAKGQIKRNLFGEPGDDKVTKSPSSALAKQLVDNSPRIDTQVFVKQNPRKSRFDTENNGNNKKDKNIHTLLNDAVKKMNANSLESCDSLQFQATSWMDFSFDKQAVLNCI